MLRLSVARVTVVLAATVTTMVGGHAILQLRFLPDLPGDILLRNLLDLNREYSFATWFSSMLLLASAAALALLGARLRQQGGRDARSWSGLALLALLVSIDEVAAVHESLSQPLRQLLDLEAGNLYFAWVIPASVLALMVVLAYARFLFRQPPFVRTGLVVAGALYLSGALGMEIVGAGFRSVNGPNSAAYLFATIVEETLELAGVLVLLHTSLRYLAHWREPLVLLLLTARSESTQPDARTTPTPEGRDGRLR